MVEFVYTITDKDGLHARPAGLLVKEASKFRANVTIAKGDKSGDAKRIFSVMGLIAKMNEKIVITAEGEDEQDAIMAIKELLTASL